MTEYDGFKRDRLSATSLLKQSLRDIWSSKISVAKYTNGLRFVMTTVHAMSKKAPARLHGGDTRRDISHISNIKRGFIGKNEG